MLPDRPPAQDDPPGRARPTGARPLAGRVGVAVAAALLAVIGAATAYFHQRSPGPFIDRGAVTERLELGAHGGAIIEPAGDGVRVTVSAAEAFTAVDDQPYPDEKGRPEVMFGRITFPGSDGYDRRPAWIIIRRHVPAMSTMSPTPFFTDQIDVVDPTTGRRLVMEQAGIVPRVVRAR